MRRYLSIFALAALGGSTVWADAPNRENEPVFFPASELRKAMMGEEFASRGMIFPADHTRGFVYGYVSAITERETRAGRWCDGHILPHEVIAQVFTHLRELENPDETPADIAVADALAQYSPAC